MQASELMHLAEVQRGAVVHGRFADLEHAPADAVRIDDDTVVPLLRGYLLGARAWAEGLAEGLGVGPRVRAVAWACGLGLGSGLRAAVGAWPFPSARTVRASSVGGRSACPGRTSSSRWAFLLIRFTCLGIGPGLGLGLVVGVWVWVWVMGHGAGVSG